MELNSDFRRPRATDRYTVDTFGGLTYFPCKYQTISKRQNRMHQQRIHLIHLEEKSRMSERRAGEAPILMLFHRLLRVERYLHCP